MRAKATTKPTTAHLRHPRVRSSIPQDGSAGNHDAQWFSFGAEEAHSGCAALRRGRTSFQSDALYRIGQCLEGGDSDVRAVMELRKDIETDVLVGIGNHTRHGGDLFL